jgi:hypothetical protein
VSEIFTMLKSRHERGGVNRYNNTKQVGTI